MERVYLLKWARIVTAGLMVLLGVFLYANVYAQSSEQSATPPAEQTPTQSQTEETSVYTYVGKIDEKAENPVDGQKLGVLKAKMAGLQSILKAMIPTNRHSDIPQPNKDEIDLFVRAISFDNERFGGGRYLADLRVEYDSEQVRALLRRERMPFAETRAPKLLVIPVYQQKNVSQLWETSNTWNVKWQEGFSSSVLVPMIVPSNDFSNWTLITPDQALMGEQDRLDALTQKYKAQGAVVAIARVGSQGEQTTLTVELATYAIGLEGWRKTIFDETFPNEVLMENLQVAKEMVVSEMEEEWKRRNLLPFDQEMSTLETTLFIADIVEWTKARALLDKVLSIRSITIKSMTIEKVEFKLNYLGSADQLSTAIAQVGLDLKFESSVPGWALRLQQDKNNEQEQ